jgi:hypothetical protein
MPIPIADHLECCDGVVVVEGEENYGNYPLWHSKHHDYHCRVLGRLASGRELLTTVCSMYSEIGCQHVNLSTITISLDLQCFSSILSSCRGYIPTSKPHATNPVSP